MRTNLATLTPTQQMDRDRLNLVKTMEDLGDLKHETWQLLLLLPAFVQFVRLESHGRSCRQWSPRRRTRSGPT